MTPGTDHNICNAPDGILKWKGKNAVGQQYFNPAVAAIHLNASQFISMLFRSKGNATTAHWRTLCTCAAFWKGQFVTSYSKAWGIISLELETETVLIFLNCHPLLTIEMWLRLRLGSRRNTGSSRRLHIFIITCSAQVHLERNIRAQRAAHEKQSGKCQPAVVPLSGQHKATHYSQWNVSKKLYLLISSCCHRLKCCSFSCKREKNVHSFRLL